MSMLHINITISGRIQGVGFRWASRSMARYLGIKGYVKNTRNGAVYIEAEGEHSRLAQFTKWCKQGPPHATVEEVTVTEAPWVGYTRFEVVYQ